MDPADRILDANLNRAREALRVMEDYARLGLEDGSLAAEAKALRHRLSDALRQLGPRELIWARDIVGDIGRSIAGAREYERASLADVVVAAGKRLTEALRVIEEIGKTRDRPLAAAVEAMRYSAYDLERRLALRLTPCSRLDTVKLYVLITESLCAGDWVDTAQAALRGGADALQLREKDLPDGEILARARRLAALCHDQAALCIVNDRPDIAALADADGVHVGQDDLPVAAARRVLPAGRIVGVSTHNLEQVRRAAAAAPDYIAVGPMFPSPTKEAPQAPGPALWEQARFETSLPLVAIGGIQTANLASLVSRGCDRICVCQAVIGQREVESAARALRRSLNSSVQTRNLAPA